MRDISKEGLSEYEDFTGILINKRNSFLRPDITILTLRNDKSQIQVKCGMALAANLSIMSEMKVGHIGKTLINIRPLSKTYWNKEYDGIDFKDGIVTFIEDKGEDMLIAEYPNGYSIDVGYIDEEKKYYVTILFKENWIEPVNQYVSDNRESMMSDLRKAIDFMATIQGE